MLPATGPGETALTGYPSVVTDPSPSYHVTSRDGTRIAVFTSGTGPPLVLVHGTAGDHTTFRVVGPRLAHVVTLHAVDRRGRGASGDTEPYAIAREFEDIAAVAASVAEHAAGPVAVFGHSYGGRAALGAALLSDRISRVDLVRGRPDAAGRQLPPAGPRHRPARPSVGR